MSEITSPIPASWNFARDEWTEEGPTAETAKEYMPQRELVFDYYDTLIDMGVNWQDAYVKTLNVICGIED